MLEGSEVNIESHAKGCVTCALNKNLEFIIMPRLIRLIILSESMIPCLKFC